MVTVLLSSVEIVHRVGFLQGVHPAKIDLGKMEMEMGTKPIKTKRNYSKLRFGWLPSATQIRQIKSGVGPVVLSPKSIRLTAHLRSLDG